MPWPHHENVSCSLEVSKKISIDFHGNVSPGIYRALKLILDGGDYKSLAF